MSARKKDNQKKFVEIIFQSGFISLCRLYAREEEIVRLVVLEDLTYEEIGKRLEITRERVRQIYSKSLRKIKDNSGAFFHLFNRLKDGVKEEKKSLDMEKIAMKKITRALLQTSVSQLGLSVRAVNCLESNHIETIGQLISYNKSDLLKFKNFGKKTLTELEEIVRLYNLQFGTKYLTEE